MTKAFYELVLSSQAVGEFLQYIDTGIEFTEVKQDYMNELYQYCNIHRVPDDASVSQQVKDIFHHFNQEYFQYDLFGTYEMQLLKYTKGGKYNWHSDYGVSENPYGDRKLSLSLQLSDPMEYRGGTMRIRDWYNREYDMALECGNAMVFDARVPHRVFPVDEGTRYAVVAWAHGPKLR